MAFIMPCCKKSSCSCKKSKAKPPLRHGVQASTVVLPPLSSHTLLESFTLLFPHISQEEWQQRFVDGLVLYDDLRIAHAHDNYCTGLRLFYFRHLAQEIPIPFALQILAITKHLIVVDKPPFMPVLPSGEYVQESVLVKLRQHPALPENISRADLSPLHRLDKDTSGVMLFSHQASSRAAYQHLFREHAIEKIYEAVAPVLNANFPLIRRSRIERDDLFFRSQEVAGLANSETHIHLLQKEGSLALYEARPISGKKHQIRLHMAALGIPIVHDRLYPQAQVAQYDDFSQPLQLLARAIRFTDPFTQEKMYYQSQQHLLIKNKSLSNVCGVIL